MARLLQHFLSVGLAYNRNKSAVAFAFGKLNLAFHEREQRVVFAHANIFTRVPFGAALTNNDVAGKNILATEFFTPKRRPILSRPLRELPPAFCEP